MPFRTVLVDAERADPDYDTRFEDVAWVSSLPAVPIHPSHRRSTSNRCPGAPPTHLFETERHGEYADPHDAVYYVRDQPPLGGGGGGHFEGLGAGTERP